MGTNLKELVNPTKRTITIEALFGKKIAIDAFNTIYQFLSKIRDVDGNPLTNAHGQITSHLSGLLYRNLKLLENNIIPIYCFDGLRKSRKLKWEKQIKKDRITISEEIIESSKKLLECLGIPWIQAPAEGEAQCCYLVNKEDAYAVASQDYDCIAFGGKRLVRNFATGSTRKKDDTKIDLDIEFILLEKFLDFHKITQQQLIDIVFLIGCDFFSGIKGFGEAKSLEFVKTSKLESLEDPEKKDGKRYVIREDMEEEIESIRKIFSDPLVNKEYSIKMKKANYNKMKEFLVIDNEFSLQRIENVIQRIDRINPSEKRQITLTEFLNDKKKESN